MTNPVQEGKTASELVEDLTPFLEELKDDIREIWEGTKDTDGREEAWHQLRAVKLIEDKLTAKIQSGWYEMSNQIPEEE